MSLQKRINHDLEMDNLLTNSKTKSKKTKSTQSNKDISIEISQGGK